MNENRLARRLANRINRFRKYKRESVSLASGNPVQSQVMSDKWDIEIENAVGELRALALSGNNQAVRLMQRNGLSLD